MTRSKRNKKGGAWTNMKRARKIRRPAGTSKGRLLATSTRVVGKGTKRTMTAVIAATTAGPSIKIAGRCLRGIIGIMYDKGTRITIIRGGLHRNTTIAMMIGGRTITARCASISQCNTRPRVMEIVIGGKWTGTHTEETKETHTEEEEETIETHTDKTIRTHTEGTIDVMTNDLVATTVDHQKRREDTVSKI